MAELNNKTRAPSGPRVCTRDNWAAQIGPAAQGPTAQMVAVSLRAALCAHRHRSRAGHACKVGAKVDAEFGPANLRCAGASATHRAVWHQLRTASPPPPRPSNVAAGGEIRANHLSQAGARAPAPPNWRLQ